MLRELIHLARHAPKTLSLKRRMEQVDLYDTIMQRADDAGFRARRAWLAEAKGDVLEIGCGTGFMFEHYLTETRVKAIDVDDTFLERAYVRATGHRNVEVTKGDAQALAFPDETFDVAIASLVFCSIPDATRALAEAKRVLRPGGELRLIEHVVSDRPLARTLMRVADPIWLHLNEQGCHMDRDTVATVRSVFDDVEVVDRFQIYCDVLPAFPMVALRARKTL
jgi:ubiquinone/menaquinone biosynthesis C-methylase UbiE